MIVISVDATAPPIPFARISVTICAGCPLCRTGGPGCSSELAVFYEAGSYTRPILSST